MEKVNLDQRAVYANANPQIWNTKCEKCGDMFTKRGLKIHTTIKHKNQANTEARKAISEILIKWSMPTRQVAISEILQLIDKENKAVLEEWKSKLNLAILNTNNVGFVIACSEYLKDLLAELEK